MNKMLDEAYALLTQFEYTIDHSLDGDHPAVSRVNAWLLWYESMNNYWDEGQPT